ncbi:MAG: flagellar biosynthetic protein FliO [Acetobacteraceae bacterium]
MPASFSPLLTAVLALAVVLGLIGIAAAAARRNNFAARFWTRRAGRGRGTGGSRLSLEASFALDPRRRLHLLRCADRQVLLLTGGPQDLLLGWLPPPEAPPSAPSPAAGPSP